MFSRLKLLSFWLPPVDLPFCLELLELTCPPIPEFYGLYLCSYLWTYTSLSHFWYAGHAGSDWFLAACMDDQFFMLLCLFRPQRRWLQKICTLRWSHQSARRQFRSPASCLWALGFPYRLSFSLLHHHIIFLLERSSKPLALMVVSESSIIIQLSISMNTSHASWWWLSGMLQVRTPWGLTCH